MPRNDWLTDLAMTRPHDPAILDDRPGGPVRTISFGELDRAANKVANALLRTGIGVGGQVAWCSRNAVEVLVLFNAARRIGALLLPLNHQLQHQEIVTLLRAARANLVLAEVDAADAFDDVTSTTEVRAVVTFGGPARVGQVDLDEWTAGCAEDHLVSPTGVVLDPAHPTYVGELVGSGAAAFTGGTTGRPKGVRYNRARVLERDEPFGRIEEEIYGSGPHVFLTSGSLSHGGPASHATAALAAGGTVVIQRRFEPEDWLRLVDAHRVTASYCAPTIVRQLCALPEDVIARYDLSSIQVIVAGAAKWSYALKLRYREVFPEGTLWELYGSSELGSNIVMRPHEHWGRPESSGRPVDGYDVVLLDDDGQVIRRPYERGVMYVKGPFVMFDGYHDDAEATAAARWRDYWTVGDVAYFDEDGYFYICDRAKDMFVSGGVNVYPAEIEAVLDAFPGVAESAVIGVPDDVWGERGHALVVAEPGRTLDPDAIRSYCREHLAAYKAPATVEVVDDLPHTEAGKVDKRALRGRCHSATA